MRAVVCFKTVKELEKVLPSDWENFNVLPDTSYVGRVIGCFDEAAMEMALRLKDSNPQIYCSALTLGTLSSAQARKIYAAGFDELVCLETDNSELSPLQTAEKLSLWLRENPADIIICGERSALNDSGSVPYYLGARLGIPVLPMVRDLEFSDNELLAHQESAESSIISKVNQLPALFVAGNNTDVLRMASLRAQMEAGRKKAERIIVEASAGEHLKLIPRRAEKCNFHGPEPDKAAALISGFIKEAKG